MKRRNRPRYTPIPDSQHDVSTTPRANLGDTAWELFHRLTLDDAERYLAERAAKRFTVIQAVVLAELDGLHVPNMNGDTPLVDDDPTRPNEAYFQHVDAVVDRAAALGLHIGMLPTWGDKWNQKWGVGPEIFTPESACTAVRVGATRVTVCSCASSSEVAREIFIVAMASWRKGLVLVGAVGMWIDSQ